MSERFFRAVAEGETLLFTCGQGSGRFDVLRFELLGVSLEEPVQGLTMGLDAEAVRRRFGEALDSVGVAEREQPVVDLGLLVLGEMGEGGVSSEGHR